MRIYICLFLVLSLLCGCESLNTINHVGIDIQRPAQLILPQTIDRVMVINNAGKQPRDIGHTEKEYSKETALSVPADSLNVIVTDGLAQLMDEKNYFINVWAYTEALRTDSIFLVEGKLDSLAIRKLAEENFADLIISLDRLIITSDGDSQNIGDGLISTTLKTNMDARFRVYYADGSLAIPVIAFRDSLQWEAVKHEKYNYFGYMSSRVEALEYSAVYIAERMVPMFIPYWQEQNRWYYTNTQTRMKQASLKAANDNWKEAAMIWGELYQREDNMERKAKLASNIALANEMLDDIENALEWATISLELFNTLGLPEDNEDYRRINAYNQVLELRLEEADTLDLQKELSDF